MPKLTSSVPKYRKHKASGQAVVTLNGRDYYLGPHDSQASHIEYDRRIAEWLANERRPAVPDAAEMTIAVVTAKYWAGYVLPRYGNKLGSDQEHNIRAALRPLLKLFEQLPATKFGPVALQAVRDEMVAAGLARTTINDRVKRIRRMFRWLASREFVPESVYRTLKTLDGLRRGETSAREPEPIQPVAPDRVEAVTAQLPDVVADMVRLQQLTGMRSGELCIMRPTDIDRSSAVWRYVPESHKTQHRGKRRVVFLGRRAQAILLRYLARPESMYCFRPADSEAKRRAARHAARKTPLSCGNRPSSSCRRASPRKPGERYTLLSGHRSWLRSGIPVTGEGRSPQT
jgi:integrase